MKHAGVRVVAALAAVVGPLLVVVSLAAVLTRPEDAVERALAPAAKELDKRIAHGADVVLLGNSKVGTDLDPDTIAELFATPARVVPMHVKGTGMPVWYTVLRERVYAGGHAPRLVVVYATALMMAQTSLPTAAQRAQLDQQVGAPDPVLDHKVRGEAFADPRIQVALRRRGAWRQALTDGIRDLGVGLALAPAGEGGARERGRAYAAPALARVFDGDANQRAPQRRVVPVVEAEVADADGAVRLHDTLIPDLVALAYAHGAQVLFVRSPMPDGRREEDTVPAAFEDELIAWLASVGAGYVDLRDADLAASHYGGVHLSRAGRARLAPQLNAALRSVGVGTGRLVPAAPPARRVALTGVRAGTPPALPALELRDLPPPCVWQAPVRGLAGLSDAWLVEADLGEVSPVRVLQDGRPLTPHARVGGQACEGTTDFGLGGVRISPTDPDAATRDTFTLELDPAVPMRGGTGGEAWWVYPGTELTVTVPAGTVTGARRLRVQAIATEGGTGGELSILGGEAAPLRAVGSTVEAVVTAPATAGEWTFTVRSPVGGPWLVLRRVVTGTEAEPVRLIGPPDVAVTVDLTRDATFAAPPPGLVSPEAAPTPTRTADLYAWNVAHLGVPSLPEVFDQAGMGCSPLELLAGGTPAREQLGDDRKPLARLLHAGDVARISVRPGDVPVAGQYALRLEPTRRCKESLWLYPGDEVRLQATPAQLAALAGGATTLELGANAFRGTGTLHLRLEADGVAPIEQAVPLSSLPLGPIVLDGVVGPDAASAVLTLRLESDDAYVLLTSGVLAEPVRPALGANP